ncbi:MAG: carbamate kinase [Saezia sp.]
MSTNQSKKPLMVLAIGGNALIADNEHIGMDSQRKVAQRLAADIVNLIENGWRVVVTHGNGPHVGLHLIRNEQSKKELPAFPLDHYVASTQGEIGYLIQSAVHNEFIKRNINRPVISLITQVEVSPKDPAFIHPTKPVGVFMDQNTAEKNATELGWTVIEDSGRGWRRVVSSPNPISIVEIDVIKQLVDSDALVIACGGGGIPVIQNPDHSLQGVEAVIDKDRVSALLAGELKADVFLIPTGVEQIAINFGKPNQKWLSELSVQEAQHHKADGQFPAGSMLPKVESLLTYLQACPQGKGIVTTIESMVDAVKGKKGTAIRNI